MKRLDAYQVISGPLDLWRTNGSEIRRINGLFTISQCCLRETLVVVYFINTIKGWFSIFQQTPRAFYSGTVGWSDCHRTGPATDKWTSQIKRTHSFFLSSVRVQQAFYPVNRNRNWLHLVLMRHDAIHTFFPFLIIQLNFALKKVENMREREFHSISKSRQNNILNITHFYY